MRFLSPPQDGSQKWISSPNQPKDKKRQGAQAKACNQLPASHDPSHDPSHAQVQRRSRGCCAHAEHTTQHNKPWWVVLLCVVLAGCKADAASREAKGGGRSTEGQEEEAPVLVPQVRKAEEGAHVLRYGAEAAHMLVAVARSAAHAEAR